jgi:hypothetical protein
VSERVRVIEHGIVLIDLSGIIEPDKELHHSEHARKVIARYPLGQALVLTDVSGSNMSEASIDALKKLAAHNKPFVKASALVGLSPLTRIVFRAVIALTRRDIRAFATRNEAIAYLHSRREGEVPPLMPASEA